jgi:hypothetical protein
LKTNGLVLTSEGFESISFIAIFLENVVAEARFGFGSVAELTRVARWFIFKPKIPIWVKFGVPWDGK